MTSDPTPGTVHWDSAATPATLAASLAPSTRALLLVHRHRPPAADDDPALELADAIGRGGHPTLFLDLARRRSVYAAADGSGHSPGLSDVLRGTATFVDVTVRDPLRSFMYVPRGGRRRDAAELIEALAASSVLERARERGAVTLLAVREEEMPARTDGLLFDAAVLVGEGEGAESEVLRGAMPVLARLPGGTGDSGSSRPEQARDRAWHRSAESPRPPAARPFTDAPTDVVFPSGTTEFRQARPNRWFVVLLCALAAALGMSILSAVAEDSWVRNLLQPPERPAATSPR